MNVQIDITGFSPVDDPAKLEVLRASVAQLAAAAELVGYPLRVYVTPAEAGGPPTAPSPTVTGMDPTGAVCGGPDLTLQVYGTGFTASSVILFNGGEEATAYISPTELTTGVKPSLVSAAVEVPVSVVGASTPPLSFAFTEPAARAAAPPKKG